MEEKKLEEVPPRVAAPPTVHACWPGVLSGCACSGRGSWTVVRKV